MPFGKNAWKIEEASKISFMLYPIPDNWYIPGALGCPRCEPNLGTWKRMLWSKGSIFMGVWSG